MRGGFRDVCALQREGSRGGGRRPEGRMKQNGAGDVYARYECKRVTCEKNGCNVARARVRLRLCLCRRVNFFLTPDEVAACYVVVPHYERARQRGWRAEPGGGEQLSGRDDARGGRCARRDCSGESFPSHRSRRGRRGASHGNLLPPPRQSRAAGGGCLRMVHVGKGGHRGGRGWEEI